jgi:hypothetical protein
MNYNNLDKFSDTEYNLFERHRINNIDDKLVNANFNNGKDEVFLEKNPMLQNPRFLNKLQQIVREQIVQEVMDETLRFVAAQERHVQELEDVPKVEVVNSGIFTSQDKKVTKKIESLPYTTDWLEARFVAMKEKGYTPNPERLLREVLDNVEQVNENRNLLYLVTSGLAVELMTGYKRRHKDLDLVLMHPDVNEHLAIFSRTDNTVAQSYWGGLSLDNQILTKTAMRTKEKRFDNVFCVHPAITLVQKTSDAWGRSPREHDYLDSLAVGYWMMTQPDMLKQRDLNITRTALESIDSPILKARTTDRLNAMFENHPWFTSVVCQVEQIAA